MKTLRLISFALMLVTLVSIESCSGYHDLDYRPCVDDFQPSDHDHLYFIDCHRDSAVDISEALRRNRANTNVSAISVDLVNDMTDDIIDDIFDSLSSSASLMTTVYLARLPLTRVPEDIQRFTGIKYFEMDNVSIRTIRAGSLTFLTGLEMLYFFNSQIETIEAGAFQELENSESGLSGLHLIGDFSETSIRFNGNLLTQFEENVFKTILESKFNSNSSSEVIVLNNPIACDCNLAWLLRDNRHLIPNVLGSCIYETETIQFKDFDPYALQNCQ